MKISENFVKREIMGDHIIIPTGTEAIRFQGLISVNETGAFLWDMLQKEETTEEALIHAVCERYDVDWEEARSDIEEFLDTLRERGILEGADAK